MTCSLGWSWHMGGHEIIFQKPQLDQGTASSRLHTSPYQGPYAQPVLPPSHRASSQDFPTICCPDLTFSHQRRRWRFKSKHEQEEPPGVIPWEMHVRPLCPLTFQSAPHLQHHQEMALGSPGGPRPNSLCRQCTCTGATAADSSAPCREPCEDRE